MFVSLFKVMKMQDIESLLIQAWKLAIQKGDKRLAEAIVSLPGLFVSVCPSIEQPQAKPSEEKKAVRPAVFHVPSGKFQGRRLDQVGDYDLKNLWSGFNGCGNVKVAVILRTELDRRGVK